ncbi:hypothetical protein CC1G_06038 [Coprinopsis cinerea okayama7|uniref:Uncharacterized protein n=1 Tax=Coprinopsis cinerea (strain Okayama-7 / 130 / ATCC MYA-4618 / FGSC 9003) TaxID=240176 RepID=A8N4G1_COPC7|nr:hypothetical protein CC1G_06038 [Coprinopsis cinerea okayama7\|eukprot:XP_001829829.1 hypothetical protein CC1G_06038 [Coprinopsis cinerea okayama7\
MAKGGKKPKAYKPPQEKFVVVVNPWGYADNVQVAVNQITAWFEVMLDNRHPQTRPHCIYYQKTHRNVIVELPPTVQIEYILGTHRYARFLDRGIHVGPDQAAHIYEYNYRRFNHPERTNWSAGYPSYSRRPPNFPIRTPYPPPELAPPPPGHIHYAIPPVFPPLPLFEPAEPQASTSSKPSPPKPPSPAPRTASPPPANAVHSLFKPYEPPGHYRRPSTPPPSPPQPSIVTESSTSDNAQPSAVTDKLKKFDPFEEEEAALRFLRSETLDTKPPSELEASTPNVMKKEPTPDYDVKPKIEPSDSFDAATDFLNSIIPPQPTVKQEPGVQPDALQPAPPPTPTPRQPTIKQEPEPDPPHPGPSCSQTMQSEDDDNDDDDDYVPSAALVAAFEAMASANRFGPPSQIQAAPVRVKEEPRDDTGLSQTPYNPPKVKQEPGEGDLGSVLGPQDRARSTTLGRFTVTPGPRQPPPETPRIKQEYPEPEIRSRTVAVKPEPMDDDRHMLGGWNPTSSQSGGAKKRLSSSDRDVGGLGQLKFKKVKREEVW